MFADQVLKKKKNKTHTGGGGFSHHEYVKYLILFSKTYASITAHLRLLCGIQVFR